LLLPGVIAAVIALSYYVDMSRHMDESFAIEALAALAQATRLAAFRRLLKVCPDEVAAGEIARACGVPHNTMSTHLAALTRAGLVAVRREGRVMHYRADVAGFRALIGFLMRDCCNGRAEICAPLVAELSCCVSEIKEKIHG
jgi:DNA-binding transcriptional ArsR family regulator